MTLVVLERTAPIARKTAAFVLPSAVMQSATATKIVTPAPTIAAPAAAMMFAMLSLARIAEAAKLTAVFVKMTAV
jgi:hypothetical protein